MTEKSALTFLTSADMSLSDIETILERQQYKGFPIVMSKNDHTLVGYINRSELIYAIREAKLKHNVKPDAHCRFIKIESVLPTSKDPSTFIDFKPWMDQVSRAQYSIV